MAHITALKNEIKAVLAAQWTGCDWDTAFGQCQVNLNGKTAPDAEDGADRFAAIAAGTRRANDDEIRERRRAQSKLPNGTSLSQAASALAADYQAAAVYLKTVEADAKRALGHVVWALIWAEWRDKRAWAEIEEAIKIEANYHAQPGYERLRDAFRRYLTIILGPMFT